MRIISIIRATYGASRWIVVRRAPDRVHSLVAAHAWLQLRRSDASRFHGRAPAVRVSANA